MLHGKQKLELTWIGKDVRPKLEPRILIEDPAKSYHAGFRTAGARGGAENAGSDEKQRPGSAAAGPPRGDFFDNRLIFGDNLLALKALEQEFTGKIKCIYIDPPYNTGSAFTHYDDGIEHSLWLSLMRDRLELLRRLLTLDGSVWVNLDDSEAHYCKVLMDEIFGRDNFIGNVIWQKKYAPANDSIWLSDSHDHVLVYAKDKQIWRPQKLRRTAKADAAYKNPDGDPRGPWKAGDYTCAKSATERPNLYYPLKHPKTGKDIWPNPSRVWAYGREQYEEHVRDKLIWWGKKGANEVPAFKRLLSTMVDEGGVAQSVWLWEDVGHTQDGRKEQLALIPTDPFSTAKPELLIERVLQLGSQADDWVLDSFAGSGTTGAVAHKMGRKWIMVELGEHCHTHIIPRLKKVIDGTDPGGITESVGWQGGGGFRYYRVGPSLLEKDTFGNLVISKEFNSAMLAEAMCKLEGFIYAPSTTDYWQQGHSTENDFIFVTTQTLSYEQLAKISEDVGPNRTLLICCSAFRGIKAGDFPNLTVKKIPKAVLSKCEWGHDDYSLEIQNLPMKEAEDGNAGILPATTAGGMPAVHGTLRPRTKAERRKQAAASGASLFDGTDSAEGAG